MNDTQAGESAFFMVVAEHRRISHAQLFQDLYALWKTRGDRPGFFCEFGATDGVSLSNTFLLENLGWSGVVAEPLPAWREALHAQRKCRIETRAVWSRTGDHLDFQAVDEAPEFSSISQFAASDGHAPKRLHSRRISVETVSLNDLLAAANAPPDFEYLSVDTEGSELAILAALDWSRYRPRVITVEHNYTALRDELCTLLEGIGYRRELTLLSLWDDWYYWPFER